MSGDGVIFFIGGESIDPRVNRVNLCLKLRQNRKNGLPEIILGGFAPPPSTPAQVELALKLTGTVQVDWKDATIFPSTFLLSGSLRAGIDHYDADAQQDPVRIRVEDVEVAQGGDA